MCGGQKTVTALFTATFQGRSSGSCLPLSYGVRVTYAASTCHPVLKTRQSRLESPARRFLFRFSMYLDTDSPTHCILTTAAGRALGCWVLTGSEEQGGHTRVSNETPATSRNSVAWFTCLTSSRRHFKKGLRKGESASALLGWA